MTPNDVAGLVGAALAGAAGTGVVFVKHVLPLFKKRDADVKAIKEEIGVGVGSDTMSELVVSVAAAVQRIENSSHQHGEGISEILRVQAIHGVKLDEHDMRLVKIEEDHDVLNGSVEKFYADFRDHDKLELANRKPHASKRRLR
jgi:hypothetical protein